MARAHAASQYWNTAPFKMARLQNGFDRSREQMGADGQLGGLAELMDFYCERAASFSFDVGLQDEGYFDALTRMFAQALKIIAALPEAIRPSLLQRLDEVRNISRNFGYGVVDEMNELLHEYGARD